MFEVLILLTSGVLIILVYCSSDHMHVDTSVIKRLASDVVL